MKTTSENVNRLYQYCDALNIKSYNKLSHRLTLMLRVNGEMVKFQSTLPNVHSFFYYFSLQGGTSFILWMSIIFGVVMLLFPSGTIKFSGMTPPTEYWDSLAKTQEAWNKAMGGTLIMPPIADPGQIEGEINFGVSWLNVPLGLITIAVSGLALYGIYEEDDVKYLFPYIAWSVAGTAISVIACLFSPLGPVLIGVIILVINIALYLYCLWVVWSYYAISKLTRSQPRYQRIPDSA